MLRDERAEGISRLYRISVHLWFQYLETNDKNLRDAIKIIWNARWELIKERNHIQAS